MIAFLPRHTHRVRLNMLTNTGTLRCTFSAIQYAHGSFQKQQLGTHCCE